MENFLSDFGGSFSLTTFHPGFRLESHETSLESQEASVASGGSLIAMNYCHEMAAAAANNHHGRRLFRRRRRRADGAIDLASEKWARARKKKLPNCTGCFQPSFLLSSKSFLPCYISHFPHLWITLAIDTKTGRKAGSYCLRQTMLVQAKQNSKCHYEQFDSHFG